MSADLTFICLPASDISLATDVNSFSTAMSQPSEALDCPVFVMLKEETLSTPTPSNQRHCNPVMKSDE